MRKRILSILAMAGSIGAVAFATCAIAIAAEKKVSVEERMDVAADALTEVMRAADKGIPQTLSEKARCVLVVPGVKRALLTIGATGAQYGRGFAACRRRDGSGWSAPAAVTLESRKRQTGGPETDIVLLVMSDSGMKHMLADKFSISSEAPTKIGRNLVCGGVVTTKTHCAFGLAGPAGHETADQTDAIGKAEMLSWSFSRGVWAGFPLDGTTVRPDEETDKELYGAEQTNHDILGGDLKTPAAAGKFAKALGGDSPPPGK